MAAATAERDHNPSSLEDDLALYKEVFTITDTPPPEGVGNGLRGSGAPLGGLDEAWLGSLLGPKAGASSASDFEEARRQGRERCLGLAAREGLRLFRGNSMVPGEAEAEAEVRAAARHIQEHGFAVILDALEGDVLRKMQNLAVELMHVAVKTAPMGNRGDHRYSLGRTTMVGATLPLADRPSVARVLKEFWGSDDFTLQCTGGDFSLPEAEEQRMHADMPDRNASREMKLYNYHDPENPDRTFLHLHPAPYLKVYYTMVDFDDQTGPPRFVLGSHRRTADEDLPTTRAEEPPTVRAFCPRGSALIMDMRVWHGGTPNLSNRARPMLSAHFSAPWYDEDVHLNCPPNRMVYSRHHRGALSSAQLEEANLGSEAQHRCRHLLRFEEGNPPELGGSGSEGGGAILPAQCVVCGKSKPLGALVGGVGSEEAQHCLACWTERRRKRFAEKQPKL